MDPQTDVATPATPDAFDAAITVESSYVEPREPVVDEEADVNDADVKLRDAAGKFTKPVVDEKAVDTKAADKKPRNDPQARIDQAIARQRDAERRAADAEQKARELETRTKPESKPLEVKAEKFPTYATYLETKPDASLEDYMDARDDWKDQRREVKTREHQETAQLEQTFSTRAGAFSESYAKATAADPELPSRIDQSLLTVRPYSNLTAADKALLRQIPNERERDAVAFRCFLADQWIESEHAIALLEHLSDPTVFQRLATLPPNQVIRALATYEAGLTAASRKEPSGSVVEPKPASKARPPFKPLGTTGHIAADDDGSEDEPVELHIRRENAKDRKAGRL